MVSKENCIAESKYSMVNRWGEHSNPTHNSEHAKDLNKNIQFATTGQS